MHFNPLPLCLNGREIHKPISGSVNRHLSSRQKLLPATDGFWDIDINCIIPRVLSSTDNHGQGRVSCFFPDTELPIREVLQSVTTERRHNLSRMKSRGHLEPFDRIKESASIPRQLMPRGHSVDPC